MKDKKLIKLPATCNEKPAADLIFIVKPKGLLNASIRLHPDAYQAVKQASVKVKKLSHDQYLLVVTRGYTRWGLFRRFKGKIGSVIFSLFFSEDKTAVQEIFSSNGHEDGLSIDVNLYDRQQLRLLRWLTWKNVFISRRSANRLLDFYYEPITLLNSAMESAGFKGHDDPREKLQAHFRFTRN